MTADAHYNEFVQHARTNALGEASRSLLKSISIETNPFTVWQNLEQLETVQHSMGISQSYPQTYAEKTYFLSTPLFVLIVLLLTFWSSALLFYFRLKNQKWMRFLVWPPFLLSAFLVFLYFNHTQHCNVGVLIGNESEVSLFKEFSGEETIANLPNGTVVQFGIEKENRLQIMKPVPGWIPNSSFERISRGFLPLLPFSKTD